MRSCDNESRGEQRRASPLERWQRAAASSSSPDVLLPLTGPSVLLPPPRPLVCVPLCCEWFRGGGQPKVKLGELCIFGEGVWLLLLWLLQRTRLRVFSEAEPDRQLFGK